MAMTNNGRDGGPTLRVGAVCAGPFVPAWQAACLRRLATTPGVRLEGVLMADGQAVGWTERARRDLRRRVVGARSLEPVPLAGIDGVTVLPGLATIRSRRLGVVRPFADALDVLLVLSECRPTPLPEPRYGVWQLAVGEGEGIPAAVELATGSPTVRARLLRLRERPAADEVLHEGVFPISGGWGPTIDVITGAVAAWPSRACTQLRVSDGLTPKIARSGPRTGTTGMTSALLGAAANAARRRWSGLTSTFHWNVGVVDAPIARFLDPIAPNVRWLPDPGHGRFFADPFGYERDDKLVVVVEDYPYDRARGAISAIEMSAGGAERRLLLEQPVHMSYPYVFEHDGTRFYVPETSEAGEVALWREGDDGRLSRVATLLPDFPGVDSTIFTYEGRFWLFCTRAGPLDTTELYAFHADRLLGPWTPHALNPIKSDCRSSRPAGTPFVHDGALYRPAQDCARAYGGGVAICRVRTLTPTAFDEEVVRVIRPDPHGPYPDGFHTLCAVGERTLVDGNRQVHVREAPGLIVRARLARTLSRLRR